MAGGGRLFWGVATAAMIACIALGAATASGAASSRARAAPAGASAVERQLKIDAAKLDLEGRRADQQVNLDSARLDMQVRREEQEILNAANRQQMAFAEKIFRHKMIAYYLQLFLTVVLTGVGIAILFIALRLSYLQFRLDERRAAAANAGGAPAATTFKWSGAGLEMSSSVIGLFVLLAAMSFFYVYIKEVYRLTDPNAAQAESSQKSPPAAKPEGDAAAGNETAPAAAP